VLFIKDYVEQEVKRATTVLLADTKEDSVLDANRRVNVEGAIGLGPRLDDIKQWESDYADVLTEESGLTDLVTVNIYTGESLPIHQRAYHTPVSLVPRIDKEIDCLI